MNNEAFNILVVDDEKDYCEVLEAILSSKGYKVKTCNSGKDALNMLKKEEFNLVITDLIMPSMDGLTLLKNIKEEHKDNVYVILLTAYGTIENAVNAMKEGAYTYIIKGNNPEELLLEVERIQNIKELKNDNEYMKEKIEDMDVMLETKSFLFKKTLDISKKSATSNVNIIILGESGVGKEVIARYIHGCSDRNKNYFMEINCHIFADNLIESELFGYEKGSFTGAVNKRIGRIEASNGGTLFLDEIGDIPLATQAKLLKVLENKKVYRIGNNEPIPVDFRLISATNKNLETEIEEGRFREDLYYRLSTIAIEIPPLRKRKEDLEMLIKFFIKKCEKDMKKQIKEIKKPVLEFLMKYDYPGNVRELKNIIERLVVLSENGVIKKEYLPNKIINEKDLTIEEGKSLKDVRKDIEIRYIESMLIKHAYNMSKTAEALGISRRQLFNKITEYGLR